MLHRLAHGLWGGFRSSVQRLSGYPLTQEERAEYRALFPEPGTWKEWWDNEDTDKALDMESSVWMLGSRRVRYTGQCFQQKFAAERK